MRTKEQTQEIVTRLLAEYPEADCTLEYRKPYELLFSVRLAAQCTDERVNMITPALFARYPIFPKYLISQAIASASYLLSGSLTSLTIPSSLRGLDP